LMTMLVIKIATMACVAICAASWVVSMVSWVRQSAGNPKARRYFFMSTGVWLISILVMALIAWAFP
jgi:hypothetical protein